MPIDSDVQTQLTRIDNLVYAVQQAVLALTDEITDTVEEFQRRHAGTSDFHKAKLSSLRTTLAAISTVGP